MCDLQPGAQKRPTFIKRSPSGVVIEDFCWAATVLLNWKAQSQWCYEKASSSSIKTADIITPKPWESTAAISFRTKTGWPRIMPPWVRAVISQRLYFLYDGNYKRPHSAQHVDKTRRVQVLKIPEDFSSLQEPIKPNQVAAVTDGK